MRQPADVTISRLTIFDLLLIVAVPLVAFTMGNSISPLLAKQWGQPPDSLAVLEVRSGVAAARDQLSRIEQRQAILHERIASAYVESAEEVVGATSDGLSSEQTRRLTRLLERESDELAREQGSALVALAAAERKAAAAEHEANLERQRRGHVAEAIASFAALGGIIVVVHGLARFSRLPITSAAVASLSAAIVTILLAATIMGWAAGLALTVTLVAIIARQAA